jgi:subtilisin
LSILASRASGPHGYAGIVPTAEVYFAAAGDETTATLDEGRLVASIQLLVQKYRCDIISISAGDWPRAVPAIETEIEVAADQGTLCFFAAGNQRKVLFPASYPASLAVAALGCTGHAPPDTSVYVNDTFLSELLAPPVYLWKRSARGPQIAFCAPGVGILWNEGGVAARAAIGTSYACPIAAGVAARLIAVDVKFLHAPRDRRRYDYAVQALAGHCRPLGPASERKFWKYGRLLIS